MSHFIFYFTDLIQVIWSLSSIFNSYTRKKKLKNPYVYAVIRIVWGHGPLAHSHMVLQKNGPLTTEIAILNLERIAYRKLYFISKNGKWPIPWFAHPYHCIYALRKLCKARYQINMAFMHCIQPRSVFRYDRQGVTKDNVIYILFWQTHS